MSLPWFRLYRDLKDDPKIGALDDQAFRVFIEALCWACETGNGGGTGLTEKNADWAFRRAVTTPLQTLFKAGILALKSDGEIFVPKWAARQKASDDSSRRVRKCRKLHNVTDPTPLPKQAGNAGEQNRTEQNRGEVHPPDVRVDDKKEEAEVDKVGSVEEAFASGSPTPPSPPTPPPEKPAAPPPRSRNMAYHPDARAVLMSMNLIIGRRFTEVDANLSLISARLNEPEVTKEGCEKMIRRQNENWKDDPKMSEYLRPATLFSAKNFQGYYANRELPLKSTQRHSFSDEPIDHARGVRMTL